MLTLCVEALCYMLERPSSCSHCEINHVHFASHPQLSSFTYVIVLAWHGSHDSSYSLRIYIVIVFVIPHYISPLPELLEVAYKYNINRVLTSGILEWRGRSPGRKGCKPVSTCCCSPCAIVHRIGWSQEGRRLLLASRSWRRWILSVVSSAGEIYIGTIHFRFSLAVGGWGTSKKYSRVAYATD